MFPIFPSRETAYCTRPDGEWKRLGMSCSPQQGEVFWGNFVLIGVTLLTIVFVSWSLVVATGNRSVSTDRDGAEVEPANAAWARRLNGIAASRDLFPAGVIFWQT
jgi:hypothetical protein